MSALKILPTFAPELPDRRARRTATAIPASGTRTMLSMREIHQIRRCILLHLG